LTSILACACLLVLSSCESKTGHVTGKIEVDGKPVENGSITFIPADGNGPTAGGIIENGQYAADVPLGNMKVSISYAKVVGKKKIYPTPNSPEMPITKEALPAKYNEKTELRYEVQPGKNEKNFELSTK
jgi:hypothetical protein